MPARSRDRAEVEQRLLPVRAAGHGIEVIQAHQLGLVQAIEQLGAVLGHLGQRQIDRRLATLLETQAGRLQQVAAAHAVTTPEVDQTLGPAGIGLAQALDIAEGRRVGTGVVVGEGGVVAQAHAKGQLDWFHALDGGSCESPEDSP